jgi:hypothetical protein
MGNTKMNIIEEIKVDYFLFCPSQLVFKYLFVGADSFEVNPLALAWALIKGRHTVKFRR